MRISVNIFKNKLIQTLIIIVGVGLIVNLSRNIIKLLKSAEEMKLAEQRIEKLEKEAQNLAQKKEFYESEAFVEQEARDKLNMVKEGETMVVLPPNIKEVLGEKENLPSTPQPCWRQWLDLFL
jgi:cell division protein FtsB